jgi:hypothetical protein
VPADPAVKVVTATTSEAGKLRLERVATWSLDEAALRAEFADRYALLDDPYWSLAGLLRPYDEGAFVLRRSKSSVALRKLSVARFLVAA